MCSKKVPECYVSSLLGGLKNEKKKLCIKSKYMCILQHIQHSESSHIFFLSYFLIPNSGKTNTSTKHHQKVKYIKIRETPENFLFTSFLYLLRGWKNIKKKVLKKSKYVGQRKRKGIVIQIIVQRKIFSVNNSTHRR